MADTKPLDTILGEFEANRNKPETVSEVNTYLFHIFHSRKTENSKGIFKKYFELGKPSFKKTIFLLTIRILPPHP